jgi:phospholipid N-methyltransferase
MKNGILEKINPGVAEKLEFLASFARKPGVIGAFAPSSAQLAVAMLRGCELETAKTVVEFGPGTGAFTKHILARVGRETLFLALELDEGHARRLGKRFSGVAVYNDSADKLPEYLARHRRAQTDYVISGLPWANMPPDAQERILGAVVGALSPSGSFTTFAYVHALWMPTARRFRRRLEERFGSLEVSRIVWRNLPPAFVYRCRGGKRL